MNLSAPEQFRSKEVSFGITLLAEFFTAEFGLIKMSTLIGTNVDK
jgi:hypothetical protein